MTMESWTQPPYEDEGGGTFSHPWTAAPAWVVPRFLMGVRPIEDGWRRIAVRPLPGSQLTRAAMTVLTPRGEVALSFEKEAPRGWALNLTIPGNTKAQVCHSQAISSARVLHFGLISGGNGRSACRSTSSRV
jgi:alpha-L-rhamnosidase